MSGSEVFPTMPSPFRQTIQSIDGDMIQRSAYDPYDTENNKHTEGLRSGGGGGGWTVSSSPPAKMKIMRRKATSEYPEGGGGGARKPRRRPQAHHQDAESQLLQQQQQAMGGVVRVCSDCNTTKTPLWRSGPRGPKVNFTMQLGNKNPPDLCSFEALSTSCYNCNNLAIVPHILYIHSHELAYVFNYFPHSLLLMCVVCALCIWCSLFATHVA